VLLKRVVEFLVAHQALAVRWLRHLANFNYLFEVRLLLHLILLLFVHVLPVGCVLQAEV